MFGNHGLGGLLKEGTHEKSPKCLGGNLGDFGEFCKGLDGSATHSPPSGKESLISNSRYISLGLSIFPLLFSDILYFPKPMKTSRLKTEKRFSDDLSIRFLCCGRHGRIRLRQTVQFVPIV